MRYTAGTTKGGVAEGELFNGVYRMGEMDQDRMEYTSSFISEVHTVTAEEAAAKKFLLDWTPVKSVKAIKDSSGNTVDPTLYTVDTEGVVTFTVEILENQQFKVLYEYDNVTIPQKVEPTSLPTLKAQMDAIELHAHARRIAVYYSQIAAFQAKTDYGFDLGEQLAAQAQGELAYEIDTEGVMMLYNGAELEEDLKFAMYPENVTTTLSRSQYYEAFAEIVARAKAIIYQRTQKFAPNYMVIGSNVLTIMPYLRNWTAAPAGVVNGPYYAGTFDSLKVYVSPAIAPNDFFFGINGSDLQTSAAVYAPYMAIVPTQLLGFADGTMSQGFSTMYDMKLLSTYNVVDGQRVDAKDGQYSWLLVKGTLTTDSNNFFKVATKAYDDLAAAGMPGFPVIE